MTTELLLVTLEALALAEKRAISIDERRMIRNAAIMNTRAFLEENDLEGQEELEAQLLAMEFC